MSEEDRCSLTRICVP